MLNKEKYANELIDMALNGNSVAIVKGKPAYCAATSCRNCDVYADQDTCSNMRKKWANSEYEEKVDWSRVKPGTRIYVQDVVDGERWFMRTFAFYLENQVICYMGEAKDTDTPIFRAWKRARLTCP